MKYPKGCTVLVPWLDDKGEQQMSRLRFSEENIDRRKVRKYTSKWMTKHLGSKPSNKQLDNIFKFWCLPTEDVPEQSHEDHQQMLDRMAVAFNEDDED